MFVEDAKLTVDKMVILWLGEAEFFLFSLPRAGIVANEFDTPVDRYLHRNCVGTVCGYQPL